VSRQNELLFYKADINAVIDAQSKKATGEIQQIDPDRLLNCQSACNFDPRIASPRMLLNKYSLMTGETTPNRFGVANGETNQHGRAA
jgi:hypothetical protein